MTHNRFAVLGAASSLAGPFTGPHAVLAEDVATGTLNPYVVSATRVKMPKDKVGNSITTISHEEIEARQVINFDEVIRTIPGAIVTSEGAQRGSVSSIRLRGTDSKHTQIVIDGIRINDANLDNQRFVGGAVAHNFDAIEILRGPQSALYGGEAIGGVISLTTPRASGEPSATWQTTAGSFNSFDSILSAQIAEGAAAWSLSFGREITDNARLFNSDFEQFFYSARFDVDLTSRLRAGITARGADRRYEFAGPLRGWGSNDPDNFDEDDFSLWTTWLEADLTSIWNSRITYGLLHQVVDTHEPPVVTRQDYKKDTMDWRNIVSWTDDLTSVFGVTWEASQMVGGWSSINAKEALLAAYGQQTVELFDRLSLTGGGRWEEYDGFGSVWTYRAAGAYHVKSTDTILRSSYGTGFRAPSVIDLYGDLGWYVGNPDLEPETSRGWDAGVEQRLFGTTSAGVTWFANDLRNKIEWDASVIPNTASNVAEAHTQGIEAELNGSLRDRLFWQVGYTYLEAEDETNDVRLRRRPEHTLGFDLRTAWLDNRLTLGAGGYAIQNRVDTSAVTGQAVDGDDYFVARAYGAFAVTDNLTLLLRLENALDEEYEEIDGYPGRPQGLFGGVKLSF